VTILLIAVFLCSERYTYFYIVISDQKEKLLSMLCFKNKYVTPSCYLSPRYISVSFEGLYLSLFLHSSLPALDVILIHQIAGHQIFHKSDLSISLCLRSSYGARGSVVGLRHYAASRKVAGFSPDEVDFLN
jgi:hypothetical protein